MHNVLSKMEMLKKAEKELMWKYESVEKLEREIKEEGVSPDDHTTIYWNGKRQDMS